MGTPEESVSELTRAAGREGWERAFWMVFRLSANPVALLDEERRVVEHNEAFGELLGRGRLEVVGIDMLDFIGPPTEREEAKRRWAAMLHAGGEYSGTRHLQRGDGSKLEVDFALRLIVLGGRRLAIYVVLARGGRRLAAAPADSPAHPLTNREREVVTLLALGHNTDDVARDLYIAPETVRSHVRNAMAKLGARTRAQLVAAALCSDFALHTHLLGEHSDN